MAATGSNAPLWYRALQARRDAEAERYLRSGDGRHMAPRRRGGGSHLAPIPPGWMSDAEALRQYKKQRMERLEAWTRKEQLDEAE